MKLFNFFQVMEILDNQMYNYDPGEYKKRVDSLPETIILKALDNPNFLNNPGKIGKEVNETLFGNNLTFSQLLKVRRTQYIRIFKKISQMYSHLI